jgi:glycosyltransferase involved in cell wall biosynthesis
MVGSFAHRSGEKGEVRVRIAFIANPELPGGWYRGIGPMIALAARGHEIVQLWQPRKGILGELVAGCDLLHIHRAHEAEVLEIVRHAKRRGIAVVYDNDDDMRAIPKGDAAHKDYGGFAGDRALREIRRLLQQTDLAIAASLPIAERFREYGAAHVEHIENYVPDRVLDVTAPPNGTTVVAGWLAGNEHHLDIERMPLRDELGRALDANPQLVIETIGCSLKLRHDRYRHVNRLDFFDLAPQLATYDIGLAPIADIPFNRARSNIKVKEYAVLGRPWLASPVGPYAVLGEKQGGRLVADDGWAAALGRLVDKPRERRKLAKQARKWGRTQTVMENAELWERALTAAIVRAGGTPRPAGRPRRIPVTRAAV